MDPLHPILAFACGTVDAWNGMMIKALRCTVLVNDASAVKPCFQSLTVMLRLTIQRLTVPMLQMCRNLS